jgi:hypothetical protein
MPYVKRAQVRDAKRRLAFSTLTNFFGSPSNQKRGFPDVDSAAASAATLLAPHASVRFSTALALVHEWYRLPQ